MQSMGAMAGRREVALKTTTTTSITRGGGEEAGYCRVVIPPSSFNTTGAVANIRNAVVAVGNDDSVHHPPEIRRHCRTSIPISPYRNVFIPLNGKGEGSGIGGGGGGGGGGGKGGTEGW